jgi:hypothetical protein
MLHALPRQDPFDSALQMTRPGTYSSMLFSQTYNEAIDSARPQ